jgi:exo-1,4-beta-D-glucosaminidase
LEELSSASVNISVATDSVAPELTAQVLLENKSAIPAFFLRLNVMDTEADEDISPIYWSDNFVTLWPGETLKLEVGFATSHCTPTTFIEVSGYTVDDFSVKVC